MRKSNFCSYFLTGIAEGCKFCVLGRKVVLFITGKCSRNCFYCSLSNKRKNKDVVWANERKCLSVKDVIQEARDSEARGAGITGGDPLIKLERTLKYAKALKKTFGEKFHIHIYLPTDKVTKEKLRKIAKYVDEVRFHPRFLDNNIEKEIEIIKMASLFWKNENIGIEMPLLPDKKEKTLEFIKKAEPFIGFVNLNELEISDTNFDFMTKHYKINEDTYTIQNSVKAGLWILKQAERNKIKLNIHLLNIHLCTAKTKNLFQYKNRLKLRKISSFGFKTKEGTVRYFITDMKNKNKLKRFKKHIFIDKKRKRIILSEKIIAKLIGKLKIYRVEELPTFDSTMIEREEIEA